MKFKRILKIVSLVLLVFTLIFIFSGITGKGGIGEREVYEADGKGMVSIVFNKENKKALELKCTESERETEDKVWMHNMEATIFKKGRLKKDISIAGDKGFVENNLYDFAITENARILSEDLLVTGQDFYLKDREVLSSKTRVGYRVKSLEGFARKGMRLNLKNNILFLYQTSGTYTRQGKSFDFQSDVLKFEDQKRALRLHKDNLIRGETVVMKGDRILILFSEDYDHVKEISSWGQSYFYQVGKKERPGEEFREISASHIRTIYDDEGNMKNSTIKQGALVKLKNRSNTTEISSHLIKIFYNKKTGNIQNIELPNRGRVQNVGKSNFEITSNKMEVEYNKKGEISICKSRGSSTFKTEEYRGSTFLIRYYADTDMVELQGRNSEIVYKKNSFVATSFEVDIDKKKLKSTSRVRSMVKLDKDSVLFSDDLIYINADLVVISDREGTFNYKDNVDVRQKDTTLSAEQLKIDKENNIAASAKSDKVTLRFRNKEDEVIMKGGEIRFDARNRRVIIEDKGIIKSGENLLRADLLTVGFDKEDQITEIYGEKGIEFRKGEETSGTSEKVNWLYNKDEIVFTGLSRIERTGRGVTKGQELRFYLKENRILIESDAAKRTETVIEKK